MTMTKYYAASGEAMQLVNVSLEEAQYAAYNEPWADGRVWESVYPFIGDVEYHEGVILL